MVDNQKRLKLEIAIFFIPLVTIINIFAFNMGNSYYVQSKTRGTIIETINQSEARVYKVIAIYNASWITIMNLVPLTILYLLSYTNQESDETSYDNDNILNASIQFEI